MEARIAILDIGYSLAYDCRSFEFHRQPYGEFVMPDWNNGLIKSVKPKAGVEGGEVIITCEGFDTSEYSACRVLFGDQLDAHPGRLVSASPSRVIVSVPEYEIGVGGNELKLHGGPRSFNAPFVLGTKLADNLHPVANPAIDRD